MSESKRERPGIPLIPRDREEVTRRGCGFQDKTGFGRGDQGRSAAGSEYGSKASGRAGQGPAQEKFGDP